MATVNKDFKIKHGLIVEGAEGTINGNVILTETASDTYILDLIGGETLVKSVSNQFDVSAGGELSLDRTVVDAYYDAAGDADAAQEAAEDFATAADTALYTTVTGDIATAKTAAEATAQGYANTAEADAIAAAAQDATDKANAAQSAAESFATAADTTLYGTVTTDIATAKSQAIDAAAADATTKANAAQSAAEDYADALIDDASNLSTEVWSAYKTSTEIGLAQAAAELHADEAIADLVNGAPELLDTLNELAAALQDNPDVITDLQGIAAGKQDALTAGDNIDITGVTISVTGLDSSDISDFNTAALSATAAAYDVAGAAAAAQAAAEATASADATSKANAAQAAAEATASADATSKANAAQAAAEATASADATSKANAAESNAIAHADALDTDDIEEGFSNLYFTDSRARGSAGDLLAGATKSNIEISYVDGVLSIAAENGVADSNTDDLAEGEENLYFTDERAIDAVSAADIYPNAVIINNLTKQVANQVTVATAGIATGISWAKESYRSAEFVVKVAYGDHTEISKVLLTLDVNDNIAITEYGNVTTNGSASTISADISGTDARLRVTTVNNNSTVTVLGTLIA